MGGNDGGFSFYVQKGTLTYGYNYVADQHFKVESKAPLPKGHHLISFEFEPTGKAEPLKGKGTPATIKLFVDGKEVGRGDLPVTIPNQLGLGAAVTVGADPGSPTMPDYRPPFAFTGAIKRALVDITGTHVEDAEAKMRVYLARQ
jgi:arylsulfatase